MGLSFRTPAKAAVPSGRAVRGTCHPWLPVAAALAGLPASAVAQSDPTPPAGDVGAPPAATDDAIRFRGALRARLEYPDAPLVELRVSEGGTLGYLRGQAAADVRSGPLSATIELGAHAKLGGRKAGPVEENGLDVAQAFVDYTHSRGAQFTRWRFGRSEFVFPLIALRDAPNVRRAWDGVRVTAVRPGATVNVFAAKEVAPKTGSFDDQSRDGSELVGVHLQTPPDAAGLGLTAWGYVVRQPRFVTLVETGPSETVTGGLLLKRSLGAFTANLGGALQRGDVGRRALSAGYYEAELSRAWTTARGPVTVGLRSSGFSGGASRGGALHTFNPLFPNFAYSTEAALQSPSNLIKAGVLAEGPVGPLKVSYRGEGLWRWSASDAFYGPAGMSPLAPDGRGDRWIGFQQQLRATWSPRAGLEVTAAVTHLRPGGLLARKGVPSGLFVVTEVERDF